MDIFNLLLITGRTLSVLRIVLNCSSRNFVWTNTERKSFVSNTKNSNICAGCYYITNNVFFYVCIPQVETVGDRIVLYILNRVIYRAKEISSEELPFLCHGEKDNAKILWNNGEAVGFYSVKPSGNLSP